MDTERYPSGAAGLIHVLKDMNARFKRASESWPQGVVPTIGDAELVYEKCERCGGTGKKDSSYVPKGGVAPVYCQRECNRCGGTGKTGHPFPKAIVSLARILANQDELTVARTLAGFAIGMQPNE